LQGRVERAGPLSLVDTVSIVEQACTGLAAAHSLGIVHRDIKPDNLFLATEQDGYIVKLLDFGIAKVAGVESESFSATRTGTVLGTPLFMSPEQVRGLRSTDLRTDLYSLAVTTYFSVTGELPFSGESFGDILLLICTASLPVPSATAPWLPPSFDAWFAKAAARDPFDRFQSAGALADALRLTTKGPAGASASSSAKSGVGDSEAQASAHPTGAAAGRQAPSASSTAGPPTWQALSESLPLGLRGSAEVLRGLMTPWFSSCSPVAPNVVRLEGPRVPHVRSLASYAVLMGADAAGANRVGTHTFMTFVTPLERHLE
jgi:serine/threonine-protein kinase